MGNLQEAEVCRTGAAQMTPRLCSNRRYTPQRFLLATLLPLSVALLLLMLPTSAAADQAPPSTAADLGAFNGGGRALQQASAFTPFVFGGTRAPAGRYPYIASLRSDRGVHFCGGALIAPTVVLTAAHCIIPASPPRTVRIGGTCRDCPQQGVQIANVVRMESHPSWNGDFMNGFDLAAIILDRAVDAPMLRVAAEPSTGIPDGTLLKVMGYGFIDDNNNLSDALLEGVVPYRESSVCNEMFRQKFRRQDVVKTGMMCAGDASAAACRGDSGGPLISSSPASQWQEDELLGVVSFGAGCGPDGVPTVYTRLSTFADFLSAFLPAPPSPSPPPPNPPPPNPPPPRPPPPVVRWLLGVCPYGRSTWNNAIEPRFRDILRQTTGIQDSSILIGTDWAWGNLRCGCQLYTRVYIVLKTYSWPEADALARFVGTYQSVVGPLTDSVPEVSCASGLTVIVKHVPNVCFP
eukprot:jgi/Tetstr1/420888/TSEL_011951.t1